jgi:hypothetical protein
MLEAIYHPYYVPDKDWFKIQLLLWDKIYRIIPYSVYDQFGDFALSEQWEIPKEYLPTIDFEMPNKIYFQERKQVIVSQLSQMAKERTGSFIDDEQFYLNSDKIPTWIAEVLLELNLREEGSIDAYKAQHYKVRTDVADFLLSCIAHGISLRNVVSPLTNIENSCFATYGNQIGFLGHDQPAGENIKLTIAGVFDLMVPNDLTKLPFTEVIKIREEYTDLRQATSRCIQGVIDKLNLEKIIDKKRSEDLINSALDEYQLEVQKFKKGWFVRTIKDWRTQSLTTILATGGGFITGGPLGALIAGGVSGGLSILTHIASDNEPSDIAKSIQYFNQINKRFEINEFAKSLAEYGNLFLTQ